MSFWKGLLGDENAAALKRAQPIVARVNALEEETRAFSDAELRDKTNTLRSELSAGKTLDDIAPQAFALVREASRRTLGERHFDVQLIGGMILHNGDIAEMRTGEGKTLVATLPAYLNALEGYGVHIVTVNDYLSRRDAVWMGQIYHSLGMTVGVVNHEASYIYDPSQVPDEARAKEDAMRDQIGGFKVMHDYLRACTRSDAYSADITYGTNNEFGFDYLRDNIEYEVDKLRQSRRTTGSRDPEAGASGRLSDRIVGANSSGRSSKDSGHHYAIVDEIDSILIDEARTPLIISAPVSDAEHLYDRFAGIARGLTKEEDYSVEEKHKQIILTDKGIEKAQKELGIENIYTEAGIKYAHHLETAVRAKALYERDKDYVVKSAPSGGGEIVIVDEFTGRLQPGRRWSEGLHQAIEAKEGVSIQQESRTFASITFQNYFRLYKKLAGMTGTAVTSSEEFYKVYGLNTVVVPTNKPSARRDHEDLIFQTESGKYKAVARKVKELHQRGQPVLVGTVSVEKNELLSAHFRQEGIPHEVLNAKNHEREGEIIAQAGRYGGVTIATNMAGRGVDIKLGGNPTSNEEYERVKAKGGLFVLATERHEARRIDNQLRGRSGRQGDSGETQFFVSLEDSLMRIFASDMIKRVMGTFKIPEDEPIYNSMITKALEKAQTRIEELNFDARRHVLSYDDVLNIQRQSIYVRRRALLTGSASEVEAELLRIAESDEKLKEIISAKKEELGGSFIAQARRILLQTVDFLWVDHLEAMEYLRSSVNLRAYGQRDPLIEYKKEGLKLFQSMEAAYEVQVANILPKLLGAPMPGLGPEAIASRVIHSAVRSISMGGTPITKRKFERNDKVVITNGIETIEMKYKKAEALIAGGKWHIKN